MTDPGRPPSLLSTLDDVLRGTFLRPEQLAGGTVPLPARRLTMLGIGLGALYGAGLGAYSAFRGASGAWLQTLSSAVKVPALFLLTLLVTFPSLYVFAALQRLPLDFRGTLRLLLVAIVVHLAVIASLAPVFVFFAASTNSYAFMLLLNVAFFALGGLLGFVVLRRATQTLFAPARVAPPPASTAAAAPVPASAPPPPPPLPPLSRARTGDERARLVLRIWCLVYGVVGAQMGWLLRPFLGAPSEPFALFRPREDNVFVGIVNALRALFGK